MENVISFVNMGFFDSCLHFKKRKTPLRKTVAYEFELYVEGNGTSFVDGQEYPHKMGNMLVCRPGMYRQSVQRFTCYFIRFHCNDASFAEKYLNNLPVCTVVPDFERFKNLMTDVSASMAAEGKDDPFYVTVKLLNLICALNQLHKQRRNETNTFYNLQENVNRAELYVQQHFGEKIRLKEIAQKAHLSPNYFLTVFKGITGKTPNRYITEVRLKEAKKRLVNTSDSMDKIAEECGFDTQAYFCYVFKKELKISPKAYRDLYRKMI